MVEQNLSGNEACLRRRLARTDILVQGLGDVQIRVRCDVVEGRPPPMLDALAYAFINRSLRAGDDMKVTGRTAPTTTRDLAAASKLGYLVAEGTTRDHW